MDFQEACKAFLTKCTVFSTHSPYINSLSIGCHSHFQLNNNASRLLAQSGKKREAQIKFFSARFQFWSPLVLLNSSPLNVFILNSLLILFVLSSKFMSFPLSLVFVYFLSPQLSPSPVALIHFPHLDYLSSIFILSSLLFSSALRVLVRCSGPPQWQSTQRISPNQMSSGTGKLFIRAALNGQQVRALICLKGMWRAA